MLDMASVEYINSAGIGAIISATKLIRMMNGELVLVHVSKDIRRLLKVINFERFIKMFENIDDCINYFRFV